METGTGQTVKDEAKGRKNSNLYSCKLDISLPRKEIPSTRRVLGKILRHLDPAWRFIRIRQDANSPLRILDLNSPSEYCQAEVDTFRTQSLSVILFLHEEQYHSSMPDDKSYETELMTSPPWQYHHHVELLNKTDSKVIATQNFYELDPRLPLWALGRVHHGSEFLRFNIFVSDFERMRKYYETLIGKSCTVSRPGFCYFVVYTHPGLEIHLSLKSLFVMKPQCTTSAALRLKFRKLDDIRCHLQSPPEKINSRLWKTKDPDGNVLLLEEIITESYPTDGKRRSSSLFEENNLVFV